MDTLSQQWRARLPTTWHLFSQHGSSSVELLSTTTQTQNQAARFSFTIFVVVRNNALKMGFESDFDQITLHWQKRLEHKSALLAKADKSDTVDLYTILLLIRDSITSYCETELCLPGRYIVSRQDVSSDSNGHIHMAATQRPSLTRCVITGGL